MKNIPKLRNIIKKIPQENYTHFSFSNQHDKLIITKYTNTFSYYDYEVEQVLTSHCILQEIWQASTLTKIKDIYFDNRINKICYVSQNARYVIALSYYWNYEFDGYSCKTNVEKIDLSQNKLSLICSLKGQIYDFDMKISDDGSLQDLEKEKNTIKDLCKCLDLKYNNSISYTYVKDERYILISYYNELYCYDISTKISHWKIKFENPISSIKMNTAENYIAIGFEYGIEIWEI